MYTFEFWNFRRYNKISKLDFFVIFLYDTTYKGADPDFLKGGRGDENFGESMFIHVYKLRH